MSVGFRRKNGIKNTTQKDCCDKDKRVAAKDMRVFWEGCVRNKRYD